MGGGPNLEEDLENWAYDGEKIGPIKGGRRRRTFNKTGSINTKSNITKIYFRRIKTDK